MRPPACRPGQQGLKDIVGTCAKDPFDPEQELLPRLLPEDRAAFQAAVARAFGNPDAGEHDLEYRILRDDGEVRWLRDTGCVIFDVSDDGERRPVRAIGSVIDLTPQRFAEAVTRNHQRQIQQALPRSEAISRQMTEGLVIFDASGSLVDMNPAALAMHGFESVDALRRHLHDLGEIFDLSALDGRPLDTHQWPIARALRGEHFIDFEVRVRNRHTGRSWIGSYGGTPVRSPDGALDVAIVTLRDVTAQREAEAALVRAKARIEIALTATEVGLWHWDLRRDRLLADANLLRLFGLGGEERELPLEPFLACMHPDDRERVKQGIEVAVSRAEAFQAEYRVVHPDGQVRWVLARGRAEHDDQGVPATFPGVAVDVTERSRAQEQLREADRRKDEFLATLAHELRNPLAPLRTGVDLLMKLRDDPVATGRALAMMDRQLTHLVRLVEDLLDVSRVSRGKIVLHKEHLDVGQIIESALEMSEIGIGIAIARDDRRLSLHLPPEPLPIEGDRVRLVQVMANLLNNAVKFSEDDGRIWVLAERQGEQVQISVCDEGVGIPPEQLPEVFEMFSQAQAGRGSGLGIGLTLVRRLVEMHGVSVSARSDGPGRGATFSLILPLSQRAPVAEKAPVRERPDSVADLRILIVDDNKDIADALDMLLQTLGAKTAVVYSGADALEAIPRFRPDLILADIGMPVMDGYELARQVRAQYPPGQLTLVAVTGWCADEDRRRVQEAGFDHHLVKPVGIATLKAVLSSVASPAAIADPADSYR